MTSVDVCLQSYYMPEGFSLGKMEPFQRHPEHIVDDVNSTEPLNAAGCCGADSSFHQGT